MAGEQNWWQSAPLASSQAAPTSTPGLTQIVAPQPKQAPAKTPEDVEKDQLDIIAKRRALGLNDDGTAKTSIQSDLSGDEFLKTLTTQDARMAKGIAEGRIDIPKGRAATDPTWQRWLEQAMQYDPEVDQSNIYTRRGTRKAFTSGPDAANVTSINTALGHLDSLAQAADSLNNFGALGPLNKVANRIRYTYLDESGDKRTVTFQQTRDAVANELMKVFRGTGGSMTEVEEWKKNIDAAQSPDQLHASIQTAADLLGSRLDALNSKYRQGMGSSSDVFELLTPHAKQIFERYGYGPPGSLGGAAGASDGGNDGGGSGGSDGGGDGGGDIGFNNGRELSRLPEGAIAMQKAFQGAFLNGDITPDAGSIRSWVDKYNQANGTQFSIQDSEIGPAIEAMKKGVAPVVMTPQFQKPDISDVRGQGTGDDQANAAVRGVGDTLTFGTLDKLRAAVDTVKDPESSLASNLDREYAITDYDEEHHPIARFAGQVLGGLAVPIGYEGVAKSAAISAMREAAASGAPIAEARTAARVAASKAVRNRMARDGALFGSAYGAGSSRSLEDIPENVITGAATGAATGAGVGEIGVRAAGKAAGAIDTTAVDAAQAADDLGIDLPKFVVGDKADQKKAAALEQTVGGSKPISNATRQMLDQSEAARDRIASEVGTAAEPEAMGDAAREAANRSTKAERKRIGGIYDKAKIAASNQAFEATNTGKTLNTIIVNEDQALGGSKVGDIMRDLASDLSDKKGMLTIDGARKTRSNLRTRLRDEAGLTPNDADRLTGMVMDSINTDIESGLLDARKPRAVALYREADREWAKMRTLEDDVLKPYIGKDGDAWGADVAKRLSSDVKGNGTRLAQFVSALPEDEANNLRASLIMRLGKAKAGNQDAAGDAFSLDTFLTNWNEINGSRNLVFGKDTVQNLDKLAKVAEVVKSAGRSRNHSNTGSVMSYLLSGAPLTLGSAETLFTGDPKGIAAGVLLSALNTVRQYGSAKLLASPAFAKKLAATPLHIKAARSFWSRPWVKEMAAKNPTIAAEIEQFQRVFLQSANDNAVSSAAAAPSNSEDDQ